MKLFKTSLRIKVLGDTQVLVIGTSTIILSTIYAEGLCSMIREYDSTSSVTCTKFTIILNIIYHNKVTIMKSMIQQVVSFVQKIIVVLYSNYHNKVVTHNNEK